MNHRIIALGELLVDFTPAGYSAGNRALFEQNPGGAPANVLVAAARQGAQASLLSAVGDDPFGHFLTEVLRAENIDVSAVQTVPDASTTLAFVSLDSQGERTFHFVRKPGADMKIDGSLLTQDLFQNCAIFHFGSLSLSAQQSLFATRHAVDLAQNVNALIAFDVNWRASLWPSAESGLDTIRDFLGYVHLLKLSEDELALLTGTSDPAKGTAILHQTYPGLKIITVTLDASGCFYRLGDDIGLVTGYPAKTIDTTGAGDAFWGVFLSGIVEKMDVSAHIPIENLIAIYKRANAAGALCTTKRGAIDAMPFTNDIDRFMTT